MTCFCRAGVFPGAFVVVCAFVALGFTLAPIVCVCRARVYPGAVCVRLSRWGLPRRRLCAFVSLGFTPAPIVLVACCAEVFLGALLLITDLVLILFTLIAE